MLQQELAEMCATIQAMQQINLQQQHPGQENQHIMETGGREEIIRIRDSHNSNRIQIKDSSNNLSASTPIQRSIAGLMEHAITGVQSVGIRQKDTRMQLPSRTKWEEAQ
eukprot:15334614-Ditylum_brightwellii.AAC.2